MQLPLDMTYVKGISLENAKHIATVFYVVTEHLIKRLWLREKGGNSYTRTYHLEMDFNGVIAI